MYRLRVKPWEVDRFTPAEMVDYLDAHRPPSGPAQHPGDASVDAMFDRFYGPREG